MPTAVDGHYTVNVYSNAGLSLSASGYDGTGVFATDIAVNTTPGAVGGTYDILYSSSGRVVTISYLNAVGVGAAPTSRTSIRALRTPTTGPVEFAIAGRPVSGDAIDVFDISGRRIAVVQLADGTGRQTVSWDWRAVGCGPGVVFARLRSAPDQVARVILLR